MRESVQDYWKGMEGIFCVFMLYIKKNWVSSCRSIFFLNNKSHFYKTSVWIKFLIIFRKVNLFIVFFFRLRVFHKLCHWGLIYSLSKPLSSIPCQTLVSINACTHILLHSKINHCPKSDMEQSSEIKDFLNNSTLRDIIYEQSLVILNAYIILHIV